MSTEATSVRHHPRPFPNHSLREAIELAQAIQDSNNGRPMNRVLLAGAIGRKPGSSEYRVLISSARKYDLIVGNEKSDSIGLSEIGVAVTHPRSPTERIEAIRRAAQTPDLLKRIYEHYNNGKLPTGQFILTVLERDFGVPREHCTECIDLVIENGKLAGLIRDLSDTLYVILDSSPDSIQEAPSLEADVPEDATVDAPPQNRQAPPQATPSERFIFVGHGKNKRALEQLKKVLDQFKILHKVAIDEPQEARPISVKVAQVMRQCHSAILIFTADEEFQDSQGTTVWRPSENVVYELGAASVLYENRIVIFKEEGVNFPTNFHDIGHIAFEKDKLDAKGLDLVRELIALGLLKVEAA